MISKACRSFKTEFDVPENSFYATQLPPINKNNRFWSRIAEFVVRQYDEKASG
jgi:hypothetical protein